MIHIYLYHITIKYMCIVLVVCAHTHLLTYMCILHICIYIYISANAESARGGGLVEFAIYICALHTFKVH